MDMPDVRSLQLIKKGKTRRVHSGRAQQTTPGWCLLGEDECGELREYCAQLGGLAPRHVHAAAHVEGAERGRAVRDERVERARAGLEEAVYGEQLEPAAHRHGDHALVTH
eukprot:scaffold1691_cov80-Phaeocystis_antarctica.AAC.4